MNGWLVGGLEHDFFDFPYIVNVIIPSDELHHIFSEGLVYHQPDKIFKMIFGGVSENV